jgi:hypothetical protein
MFQSILKNTFATGMLTILTLSAKAQSQFPDQLNSGFIKVAGRASATTETQIDVFKCADQSIASCTKFTQRPLPLNTPLAVPGGSYYRALVNGKMQEQALYIRQNETQVVQLSFLTLPSPSTPEDFAVTLVAETLSSSQRDYLALELVLRLKALKLPEAYEDGPKQSFLDFCSTRTFFITQYDAPGRGFKLSVAPEVERLCAAVKNGHNVAVLAEMTVLKPNGLIEMRDIDFSPAFYYSKKPKHIALTQYGTRKLPGLVYKFIYGEPKPTSAGWNVLPGQYHLYWENERGEESVRTVSVQ